MTLPVSTRKPGVYLDENITNAIQGLFPTSDNVCIIAQRTSSGTVPEKVPTVCFSDADAALYFGSGSVAHLAARSAFMVNPSLAGYTVVGVDDAGGSIQAQGQIDVGSVPATGGTLNLWIGDVNISCNYPGTYSATDVVNGLASDASAVSNILPVTLTPAGSTLGFTAKNAGRVGNMIPIKVSDAGNGSTWITITAMTSGSGDPDVGNYGSAGSVLASVVGGGYTIFVNTIPNNVSDYDSATKVQTMDTFVSGQIEQRPAIQVFAVTDLVDTYSNVKTLCGTDLNKGRTTCAYLTYTDTSAAASEYFKIAAAYAADLASQSDPALPYNGDVLTGIAPPAVIDRLTRTVQEDLLHNGVTPLAVVPGEKVTIVKAITTYVTNIYSNPDATLLNVNTYRVLDYVRKQMISVYQSKYSKSKITSRLINSVIDTTYNTLKLIEVLEIVKDVDTYKTAILATINSSNPSRIDVEIPTAIVSPLDIIAGELNLIIS